MVLRVIFMALMSILLLSCETMGINADKITSLFRFQNSSGARNITYPDMVNDIDMVLLSYSPESARILDDVAKAERNSRKDQILLWYYPGEKDGREDFYNTLDTAVHETNHKFTSLNIFGTTPDTIQEQYLIEGKLIKVQHSNDPIKTEMVTGSLPVRLRTFRWSTYVAPNAEPTANQHGIYGLLDELNAYYRGLKAVYECFPYFAESDGFRNADMAKSYIGVLATDGSSAGAFYEFKYWILQYLLYTKEKAPARYRSIIQNKNFLQVFFYIHDNFQLLVEEMVPKRINELVLGMQNAGLEASLEEIQGIGIAFKVQTTSLSSSFVPLYDTITNAIRADMKREQYTAVLGELRAAFLKLK